MADDLRHRYAEALHRSMTPQTGFADHLDAVMAVRDTELETARAALTRVREIADDWATLPPGTYARAGKRILAALDTPEGTT